jgi:hypothetical protein
MKERILRKVIMKSYIVRKIVTFVFIFFTAVILPSVISVSCENEDACDAAREECYDQGGTPQNCEESVEGCYDKCQCECVNQHANIIKKTTSYYPEEIDTIKDEESDE